MTETELEYHFCFNCNERKQCYTKPKDCTRIKEEIGLQSNIEWMREASLEELAEYLASTFDLCGAGCHHCFLANVCLTKAKNGNCLTQEQMIVEWLKQPHT